MPVLQICLKPQFALKRPQHAVRPNRTPLTSTLTLTPLLSCAGHACSRQAAPTPGAQSRLEVGACGVGSRGSSWRRTYLMRWRVTTRVTAPTAVPPQSRQGQVFRPCEAPHSRAAGRMRRGRVELATLPPPRCRRRVGSPRGSWKSRASPAIGVCALGIALMTLPGRHNSCGPRCASFADQAWALGFADLVPGVAALMLIPTCSSMKPHASPRGGFCGIRTLLDWPDLPAKGRECRRACARNLAALTQSRAFDAEACRNRLVTNQGVSSFPHHPRGVALHHLSGM